ncbi:MAG: fibronectin type III domain-containing protein, partial [Firmicutes bacterium]|nr:fibronectin type III domain-containing protein [Bacillota bacterium]
TVDTKTGDAPTELTPNEYVTSDLVRSGMGVGGDGTKWVAVEVCLDTKAKATEYCPNKEMSARLVLPDGKTPSASVADIALYAPTEFCKTHTTKLDGMVSVYICTECTSKTGVLCMANRPAQGSSGGCPAEFVQLRYYMPNALPTAYCSIASHQVNGEREQGYDPHSGGNSGGQEAVSPDRPYGLTVSSAGNALVLNWDFEGSGDIEFVIERKNVESGESTPLSATGTSYTDSDVEPGVTYTYRLYAYDSGTGLSSDWSSSATGQL